VLTAEALNELLYVVGLEWDESDRDLLDPIVDAALVYAEEDVPASILHPILEALWRDGFADDIVRALDAVCECEIVKRERARALADLATGPCKSKLGRAIVLEGAADYAFRWSQPEVCMLCLEEAATRADTEPGTRKPARRVARLATRAAAVPASEIRKAVVRGAVDRSDPAVLLATDVRRTAVRAWLGRIASLGASTLPNLSAALRVELEGPLPPAADDVLWRETVDGLVAALAPGRN